MRRECRENLSPPPISKETASYARAVMHVVINKNMGGEKKRSRHFRSIYDPLFCVSGIKPMNKKVYHLQKR